MNKECRFISFDQSTKMTGWCLWINGEYKTSGVLNCSKEKDSYMRFLLMVQYIFELINKYEPHVIYIEDTALQTNAKTLKDLSQLQGVIIGCCIAKGISYEIISPTQWRKILNFEQGRGMKRKDLKYQAIQYVLDTYEITATEDEVEAIALGSAVLKKFN